MKPANRTGLTTAAQLISDGIEYYTRNPAARRRDGVSLSDLSEAAKVRRKLLKQRAK
ncbi:hypothetical protein [Fibrella aestuarina]|uniref:hypothetical protein n=1 Tax=Fibrella aestuarina TaxID=651143 RepID=UPI00031B0111|nr:hypothetical protein [Fibrella aestuarina]